MTSPRRTNTHTHPIRLFGPHNGHEVFWRTVLGVPFPRTPEQVHPDEVLWLSDSEHRHFDVACAYSVFGYSSAARPNVSMIKRLLAIREEWCR